MSSRPRDFAFTSPGSLRLYSTPELIKLPPPKWLVRNIIPAGGVVGLYAEPGAGKSFLATDITMCVGSGEPWQGEPVEQGEGLYISAEGGAGMGKRAAAWCVERGRKPSDVNVAWLIEQVSVNPDSDTMERLFERIFESRIHPKLIVIDTLARCLEGDENGQEDMGRFIAGVDSMRREFGSAVIIVHHTRLGGDRERGNTAFRGAADTMIELSREKGGDIVMKCNKQKDAEEFAPKYLKLKVVPGATPEESSCVITAGGTIAKEDKIMSIWATDPDGTYMHKELVEWGKGSGLSEKTAKRAIVTLTENGKIIKENGLYIKT